MSAARSIPTVGRIVDDVRRYLLRRTVLALSLTAGTVLLLLVLVASLAVGGDGWARRSVWPLVLDGTGVLLLIALLGVWRVARERWFPDPRLAAAVERAAGLPAGSVRGTLELERAVPDGASRILARQAGKEAALALTAAPRELSGELGRRADTWFEKSRLSLGILVPILIVVSAFAPGRSADAVRGLASPISTWRGVRLPPLVVTPGTAEIVRGAPMEVRVEALGRDSVTLHVLAAGEVSEARSGPVVEGAGRFQFPSIDVRTEYWAEAPDGARSDVFVITPVDPLLVTDLLVELTFPPHTGRFPEEYRGVVPALQVPVGTRLRVSGRASRALSEASLGTDGAEPFPLQVTGPGFSGELWPRSSGLYDWDFLDTRGERPEISPDPMQLTVVRDSVPELRVVFPGVDTLMPLGLRQPLVVEVRDDFGLRDMEVIVRTLPAGVPPEPDRLDLAGARAVVVRPLLDLSEWSLLPGDSVGYRVRATDNSPAEQSVESREYILRVPSVAELRRDAEDALEDAARQLEEMADRAAQQAEESRELEREAEAQGNQGDEELDFESREDVRQALEQEQELVSDVDALAEELEALQRALENGGLTDPELKKDLEELQRLLEEIASQELEERLDELSRDMDEMDAREAREKLEELAESQEEFRKKLEESLERFRRAAVEQDFRATTEEAEELARRQEALADAMREEDNPQLREEQQSELSEEAQALDERMERLEERLEKLGEERAAERVEQARQRANESREAMAQAQRQAQDSPQEAAEAGDQAASEMQEAAEQLQQAQQEMQQQLMEDFQQAMQQAADDALLLARQESGIREQTRGASPSELAELRADQATVGEGLRNLQEQLAEAAGMSPMDGAGVQDVAEAAAEQVQRVQDSMERRRGATPSPTAAADRATNALNRLAMAAMQAAQQAGEGGESQSSGEQVQEQLEQLAEQQGDVMNESSQLMPMQLGEQAMQQQMQQIAQGQEEVADELGDLADQPGAEDEALGDLKQLAEEAAAIAELLQGGRLDRETLERQERLFHRLLDAGRSLEKEEEESDERESERVSAFERGTVSPLTDAQQGRVLFELPDAEVMSRLSPAERQLVLQYFERLNRSREGSPSRDGARPEGGGRR